MASPLNDKPHFPPSPPSSAKPPPHPVTPPPRPLSPNSDSTVVIVVFVSFGCLFFVAFLLVALCCFIKKMKKKRTVQETDTVHHDEHMEVKEAIVTEPHGAQAVVLSINDDVHVEEEIRKNETFGKGAHVKSADNIASALQVGESSSSSGHHHLEHKP